MSLKWQSDGGAETEPLGWGVPGCQHWRVPLVWGNQHGCRYAESISEHHRQRTSPFKLQTGNISPRSPVGQTAPVWPSHFLPGWPRSSFQARRGERGDLGVSMPMTEMLTNPHFSSLAMRHFFPPIPKPFQILRHIFSSLASPTAGFLFNFPSWLIQLLLFHLLSFQNVVHFFPVLSSSLMSL